MKNQLKKSAKVINITKKYKMSLMQCQT